MTATATLSKHESLLPYVQGSAQYAGPIDRDRAMEFLRRCTPDVKVFKLILMGAGIAFGQVRKKDQEVLGFFADFLLDTKFNAVGKETRRVILRAEIRKEVTDPRLKEKPTFFEFDLIVNAHGHVVDVDFTRLQAQLLRNIEVSSKGYRSC